jgi:hypothetical protein
MQVILHSDFSCAPEGHTTYHFKAGDTLTGRAAEMALANDKGFNPFNEAKPFDDLETKPDATVEKKRGSPRKDSD